ncbi:haloacid dehalogenase type II [Rhabdaerophilum calidifontis]|uniref:haloacid dehalogenase type II n=1 Tax=Rhabdaerophilum calidifontis TaxID=2604328 RepID=UPI001238F1AD|nr:haloacid dehalogenase type II [Rhabdaerophilum calidifontis]
MPRIFMFDAYGTLFDVHAAVARAGASLGARAEALSALWRAKQLEYSWTMTLMGRAGEVDFWTLTGRALDFALARFAIDDPALRGALLDAYPDVAPALAALKAAGHRTAIFTNGTRRMVEAAIAASGIGAMLDHVITVEPTGRFKPDPAVYAHARAEAGAPPPRKIVFVSSNRWDVAAAAHAGFTPIWVNRSGQPGEYPELEPAAVMRDLSSLGKLHEQGGIS